MDRDIEKDLLAWKQQTQRMPILLRGARQVGKSYVVEKIGRTHFDNLFTVNFELQPELIPCFETLDPFEIIQNLSLLMHRQIEAGKTLLFLDEIQDCPNAIRALRYFKEQMPELHVIAAGSLLEFTLNDAEFRMPVGRVMSLYLKPLSFKEYLTAVGCHDLRKFIEQVNFNEHISDVIHQSLLKQVRHYMVVGGMPAVINAYLSSEIVTMGGMTRHYDFNQSRLQHAILLNNYRQDFGKYAKHTQIKHLQRVFEKAPGMVGEHFKYVKVDPTVRSEQIKATLELLQYAGLIYYIYSTAASGIPWITLINERKFKILFLDVGLMVYASRVEAELLLNDIILVNRGAIAEQFVGQELLAYSPNYEEAKLFFWCREKKSSMAEVDYIISVGSQLIPIEVKAGSTGQLKSLHLLMHEKNMPLGVRVSQLPLHFDGRILSVPIYMVSEITRLVGAMR
ncbi:MAG: ATP-binding protein [Gammaproteobacteria bacterium]|nr:ATP-binding protein [Gammaproteobacteria bacterium]